MLEDPTMDKKSNNRSSQSQSRASAVDCKKSSDSTHKPLPRYNKKREGPASAPKNEPYRRNQPAQRGRGQVDRRPRARGPSAYAMGGMEITGIADDEPELGSVFVPGSKKQNLNHLLNFMYTPRGERGTERRGAAVGPRRYMPRATHPHNHALYLQAWCQFVVKEDGDYKVNLLDPDVPIKWDFIEEIVVRSAGKSECPICLGTPAAGRVGHCGHVHCWACALHYAATHDKQPPPCPVCAAPFRVDQMKPARIVQWEAPADEVTMRLVRRLRGSTMVEVAPPRGQATNYVEAKVLPLACIEDAPYAKLFSATKQQVIDILERERKEIQEQILAEIDTTEIVYMDQALESLKKQEENLKNKVEIPEVPEAEPIVDNAPTVYEKAAANTNRIDWFDEEAGAACMENIQEQLSDLAIANEPDFASATEQSNLNPEAVEFEFTDYNDNQPEEFPLIESTPPPEDEQTVGKNMLTEVDKDNQVKYFYFYQADDGQQVFLDSLNVRVLTASWGALAAAPPLLRGRVLHRETLSLVEQTRKHMPYAAHLPLHCPFDLVELDLQPPYVTSSALESYSGELERRARTRARNEREERRRERAFRRAAEGPPRPDFSSELLFPPTSPPQYSSPAVEMTPSPVASPSANVAPSPSGLSFAKMASTSGTWRVRPTKPTRAVTPPPTDDGEESAPRAPTHFLSDAIEAALHAAPPPDRPTGKRSKRAKQKVLFATGMQRAG